MGSGARFVVILLAGALAGTVLSCSTAPTVRKRPAIPRILVTSFEPFGGRGTNLSSEVARELASLRSNLPGNPEIELCSLPVVYDLAAVKARECFARLPEAPVLALSLGEGGCDLRLETAATNIDHTPKAADNAGTIRTMSAIVPGAERRLGFTLPVRDMYCAIPTSDRAHVVPSISAGNYVCNNTAYHLARFFREQGVPYGFVHVPHSGCKPAIRDTRRNAATLAAILRPALETADRVPASELELTPTTAEETETRLRSIASARATQEEPASQDSCTRDFLEQLLKRYGELTTPLTIPKNGSGGSLPPGSSQIVF